MTTMEKYQNRRERGSRMYTLRFEWMIAASEEVFSEVEEVVQVRIVDF
jgi:hypothetical protein